MTGRQEAIMDISKGTCHCGRVKFEIHGPIRDPRRCDCSLCRRKGAIMLTAAKEEFHLVEGEEHLGLYQWNTKTAKHYFCKHCGIYTHHWRRSAPEYGYNAGCVQKLDIADLGDVPTFEGHKMSIVDNDE